MRLLTLFVAFICSNAFASNCVENFDLNEIMASKQLGDSLNFPFFYKVVVPSKYPIEPLTTIFESDAIGSISSNLSSIADQASYAQSVKDNLLKMSEESYQYTVDYDELVEVTYLYSKNGGCWGLSFLKLKYR